MRPSPAKDTPRLLARTTLLLLAIAAVGATACGGSGGAPSTATPRQIPSPVAFRQVPQGITLGDPSFQALPGARADFGQLGGAAYQIEMPDKWNGRLLLFMHGYGELAPEARASAPGIRTYLILHGYAWGASSFSSTSFIPGRSADETAALWDYFVRKYRRPDRTYVTGQSMGGAASNVAAEHYGDRFDGALALCGSADATAGANEQADFFAAAAYVAGVMQAEFDASTDVGALIRDKIMPALQDPTKHKEFQDIMIDVTGGPRAFDREGFQFEEETNWRRATPLLASHLTSNAGTTYTLGPTSAVRSADFNRDVIRLSVNEATLRSFVEDGDTSGQLEMPLLALHTTGDGQVPINQAQILQRRVDAAGKSNLLVQRVFADPGHCGFTNAEWATSLEALVGWVERGVKPSGDNVLVSDLRALGSGFELTPRQGSPQADAVTGARDRVVLRGNLTLDGAPLDSRFLGVIVRRADRLVTPCQYALSSVSRGSYEITVLADAEASGCGAPGAAIFLWTSALNKILYTRESVPWPGNGVTVTFDASFSGSGPDGGAPPVSQFFGEVFDRHAEPLPPATRIEAYAGAVRCGVASTRRTGSYSGYIMAVVGPDSVAGCERGATLTFRIDGQPAAETSINDPNRPGRQAPLDLILR